MDWLVLLMLSAVLCVLLLGGNFLCIKIIRARFSALRWKTDSFGTSATMWCRESKKAGVYKYTVVSGDKTLTFIINPNSRIITDKYGKPVFPVKVILGKPSGSISVNVPF